MLKNTSNKRKIIVDADTNEGRDIPIEVLQIEATSQPKTCQLGQERERESEG